MRHNVLCVLAGGLLLSVGRHSTAESDKPAEPALAILEKFCGTCHHEDHSGNMEYDVLSLKSLLKTKPSDRILRRYPDIKAYVVPGKPDESLIWQRAGVKKE